MINVLSQLKIGFRKFHTKIQLLWIAPLSTDFGCILFQLGYVVKSNSSIGYGAYSKNRTPICFLELK